MNNKLIITAVITLGLGIVIGYFLFAGAASQDMPASDPGAAGTATQDHSHPAEAGEAEIWTCSMHPQIRQGEPGDCPICGMDLILLEENTSNDPLVLEMTENAVKLANIQTTVVGRSGVENTKRIRLSGKVREDERRAASLVAHVPGRIEKLMVTFKGEQVRKGQQLATIYSPDLISAQRELLEALKLQSINPALVEAARDKLRYWKIKDAVIKEIESSGTIRENFTLYANASGIVKQKKVEVGDYVNRGEVLFDVLSLDRLWVVFNAYEEDLAHIRLGDRIEFSTPAIPNKTFKTRVTYIDPIINPQTRVAAVRTEIGNPGGLLKPEMLVYGTLEQQSTPARNAKLTVPKSAVLWTGKRSVVYVKVPEVSIPSYKFRLVEIGESLGNSYEVLSGLEAGEEVVTKGNFAIDAAAQLNNQASMMNQEVKIKKAEGPILIPDFTTFTPSEFQRQLMVVTEQYLALKDALVNTDPVSGASSANDLLHALEQVDMALLANEEAHMYWMEQRAGLLSHAREISESDNIEEQRRQFDFLSQVMIHLVKAYGLGDHLIYVQHCPMANNDQGADWLSDEKEIRNPYFGEVMMTCGVVKETLESQSQSQN